MDKKYITFLVATDRKGVTKRFVVSSAWLKAIASLAVIVGILAVVVLVDYVGLLIQSVENKRLRAENRQLKSQFEIVEGKLSSLESGLERVSTFAKKLRLITDIEDPDRALDLSVSPQAHMANAEAEDMGEDVRLPSSVIKKDNFIQKPLLDIASGELAAQQNESYSTLSIRIDKAIKETGLKEQGIHKLWGQLSSRQSLLKATPSIAPARGVFTSGFGYRISPFTGRPTLHQGLDIAAAPGAPVYAPADGVVSYAGWDTGYGKLVSIDHGFGLVTRFGHNSKLFVVVGQKIKRGDVIAAVGSTGRSTGIHVHYEVRVNNVPVDPSNYILTE